MNDKRFPTLSRRSRLKRTCHVSLQNFAFQWLRDSGELAQKFLLAHVSFGRVTSFATRKSNEIPWEYQTMPSGSYFGLRNKGRIQFTILRTVQLRGP